MQSETFFFGFCTGMVFEFFLFVFLKSRQGEEKKTVETYIVDFENLTIQKEVAE